MSEKVSKEERQLFLQKLLDKEMEKMRLIVFPYKRRPLLDNLIEICEDKLEENAIGMATREKIGNYDIKYKCKHKIIIHYKLLDYYFNHKYYKRWHKANIVEVIQHELLHCFVEDNYGIWSDVENISFDASPIFLALIEHFNFYTSHKCWSKFIGSKIYNDVKNINNWKEMDAYISKLIINYNRVARELKEDTELNTKNPHSNTTNFSFAARDSKLVPLTASSNQLILKDQEGNFKKCDISNKRFNIGCNVLPEDIKNEIDKYGIEQFKVATQEKTYMIVGEALEKRTGEKFKCIKVYSKEIRNKSIELKS